MKLTAQPNDFRISRSYKATDWQKLSWNNEEDWQAAIEIVRERLSDRFVRWIDLLILEDWSGFATVALDCLLLEALHGFQEGATSRNTTRTYTCYLGKPAFGFNEQSAKKFQKEVRNKLLHNGQTHGQWLIRKKEPENKIFEQDAAGNFILNRTAFHRALKSDFDSWILELKNGSADLRSKMRKRMEEIICQHSLSEA